MNKTLFKNALISRLEYEKALVDKHLYLLNWIKDNISEEKLNLLEKTNIIELEKIVLNCRKIADDYTNNFLGIKING